ncbi:MAG: DUF222 domain-containing protein [Actinomycetota bacterium]
MSTIRSGLDELRGQDLRFLSDEELTDRLQELARSGRAIEAESARTVAEIDRRRSFERDGHLSVTSWIESRIGVGWSEAAKGVRVARALEEMPGVREALAEGEVSSAAVGTLVAARETNPEEFAKSEEILVEAARSLPVRDLKRAVEHWRSAVEPEAELEEERERFERRVLHVSPTFDGMVRVDGNLDPETGQCLITAMRSVTDAEARSGGADTRTPGQRRADAVGEICRGHLDRADRPVVGGERPHVTVVLDLESLEGRAGRRCELDDVGRVTPSAARRLACDASVARVITTGRSEPLEIGRRTPVVPASLRRAVAVRDRGCRFPSCDRRPGWCDAHHAIHWSDGAETALSNLVSLCRRHHRMVHDGFGVRMTDGVPVFTRPDGSVLEDRAPP